MKRRTYLGMFSAASIGLAGCLSSNVEEVEELPRPYRGDEDADVVVDAFEDMMCPGCRNFVLNELPQIEAQYIEDDLIRFNHFDFIVGADGRWSYEAANAARYIQDNYGMDEFFDFKRQFYEQQDQASVDLLQEIGEDIGVESIDEFLEAASNGVYQPVLDDDYDEAQERGAEVTPTVYINGEPSPEPAASIINDMIAQQLE